MENKMHRITKDEWMGRLLDGRYSTKDRMKLMTCVQDVSFREIFIVSLLAKNILKKEK